MVTKDYYRMSSHVFPLLCFSLDFHRFFAKKLASSIGIPYKNGVSVHSFDEVQEYCTSDVPGEVFSDFSDESEEDISDHHESEDDIYEENDIPSSNFGDSNAESDSNSMCFSVCLSQQQILPINFCFTCYIHTLIPSI